MAASTLVKYEFTAKDKSGKLVEGKVDAESEAVLREKLLGMGAMPLDIRVANAGMQKEITLGLPKRVKLKDLAIFSRQFATMLSAGLPLIRCMSILSEQTENDELARVLRLVKTDIEEGNPLSRSLERHPKAFPPLMINMIKAGEVGGFLDQTMLQVAEAFEADVKLRGKIKAALTYPVVIFILAILMCVGMLIFIVPVFEKMFTTLGGDLPLPTKILVALSNGLKVGMPFILVGLVGFVVWWRKNSHKPAIRNVMDPLKLRLPVFGNLFQKVAIARFTRNFGTLLRSGVPLLQALDIVADTTGSVVISRALRDVEESVRQGESIHKPLAEHEVFPPMVVQMVAVGEDTGAIDEMLHKIAAFYDEEVESTTEQLTALIEPLMIAFLGGVVGSMIIALYMPIFKVFDLIS